MTLTATAQPSNDPPRVSLSVDGLYDLTSVSILREDPDGRLRPVRTADPATVTAGAWLGFDYEAPFGVAVTYSAVPPVSGGNLLSANQAGLETDTTGWAANDANTTIARTTAQYYEGTASLSITPVSTGTTQVTTPTGTAGVPVTGGEHYTASARFRAGTQFRPVYITVTWYNAAGGAVAGNLNGTPVNDSATGWLLVSVAGYAPATAAFARVVLTVSVPALGEFHYADEIKLQLTKGMTQVAAPLTLAVSNPWLIHPGIPDLSVAIPSDHVEAMAPRVRAGRSALHRPLGRATPIAVSEVRGAPASGIDVVTDTLAARDALLDLLADGSALLLNLPPALGWGTTAEWVNVGDVTETAIVGNSEVRRISLPYDVTDRPVGGVQAEWTWAGVLAGYASWADVAAAYDTHAELLANAP